MQLTVNGKPYTADPGFTVDALLRALGLPHSRVAVAVNGRVSPKNEHTLRVLSEGDEIEVIHAVAGG